MNRFFALILILIVTTTVAQNNIDFVNVFIGTDGTGHTFPGPSMPFGLVQPSPDNCDKGWNHTSGYQYHDTVILGYSQTHLSGTGINELGDILLLPIIIGGEEKLSKGYFKESEKASVGYYSHTKKDGIKVELTCSERVALHRYTFPGNQARVVVDFNHGLRFLTDSLVLESNVIIEDSMTISGFCHTKNWVERRYFFTLTFDQSFISIEHCQKKSIRDAPIYSLNFLLGEEKTLQVKVALSTVSVDGAKLNMKSEMPGWDFNKVKRDAEAAWSGYLDRIDIDAEPKQKEIFYTSLYHLLLQPSNIADVNGKYRGPDNQINTAPNKEYYSTLSIWDIYRGVFPLLQLIVPERVDGIINTMLLHYKAAGFLPIWTVWGQDNYCMIGNHSIPMILSATVNGFKGFDRSLALEAMVKTSTESHINSDWDVYTQFGYYPYDLFDNESVSRTLESGYDDWCVSQMASILDSNLTAQQFLIRANYYKNLFDSESRLFRGKDSNGSWRRPFDPLKATSPMNNPGDYTEANAWQYFWTPAQYDVNAIISLLGGKSSFTQKLDTFFNLNVENPDKFLGQEAMIGQYAHGNEPSHHILYLYAYSGSPFTGQKYIHQVINNFHNNTPDGMIGNDDCGQMSAWYILSTLGFYPVNPASGEFVLGAPQVRKARLHLDNGRSFLIEAKNISHDNIFSDKVFLNGKIIKRHVITFQDIQKGGRLIFEMKALTSLPDNH